jgi:hypothetical protein
VTTLLQVATVALLELRLGVRRGAPVVGMAATGLLTALGALYVGYMNVQGLPRSYGGAAGAQGLAMAWPIFEWMTTILLPMVTAAAIPADRQMRVRELQRSLPIGGGVYLAGKMTGSIAAVVVTGAGALAVYAGLHLALVGPLQVTVLTQLTFLSALPLVAWGAALGVVAGAFLATRQAALLVGAMAGLASRFLWSVSVSIPGGDRGLRLDTPSQMTYQAMSRTILGRHGLLPPHVSALPDDHLRALASLGIMAAVLLALIIAARVWLREKEGV